MKTVYDVQQLLKKFGTIIYTGNRIGDLDLMHLEINDLFQSGMIEEEDYIIAKLIIKNKIRQLKS